MALVVSEAETHYVLVSMQRPVAENVNAGREKPRQILA